MNTWCNRNGSASTGHSTPSKSTSRSRWCCSSDGRICSTAPLTTLVKSTNCRSNRNVPLVMRAISSMSSTSLLWMRALRSMAASARGQGFAGQFTGANGRGPPRHHRRRGLQLMRDNGEKPVLRLIGGLRLSPRLELPPQALTQPPPRTANHGIQWVISVPTRRNSVTRSHFSTTVSPRVCKKKWLPRTALNPVAKRPAAGPP